MSEQHRSTKDNSDSTALLPFLVSDFLFPKQSSAALIANLLSLISPTNTTAPAQSQATSRA